MSSDVRLHPAFWTWVKGGKEHVVPLVPAALAQLPFHPVSDVTLAKVIKRHTKTPATTHGLRSTFRDWAGDCSHFPREIAEAALAHTLGEVERAYPYTRCCDLALLRSLKWP